MSLSTLGLRGRVRDDGQVGEDKLCGKQSDGELASAEVGPLSARKNTVVKHTGNELDECTVNHLVLDHQRKDVVVLGAVKKN